MTTTVREQRSQLRRIIALALGGMDDGLTREDADKLSWEVRLLMADIDSRRPPPLRAAKAPRIVVARSPRQIARGKRLLRD
jgi:hypothetical protein